MRQQPSGESRPQQAERTDPPGGGLDESPRSSSGPY